ncbi:hypothetical protein QCE49_33035 [Caballeronia sp. LZ008]|uniref:hypothetical protein n=1 Tax=Caballeronia sp. INML5 TaxID=2921750 RepID=UPI00202841D1|nr:hypothetical protein [Caballeronia sp. INML5]MDR5798227.1 hypothetical protein [Caballeronia sp. LZ008]
MKTSLERITDDRATAWRVSRYGVEPRRRLQHASAVDEFMAAKEESPCRNMSLTIKERLVDSCGRGAEKVAPKKSAFSLSSHVKFLMYAFYTFRTYLQRYSEGGGASPLR